MIRVYLDWHVFHDFKDDLSSSFYERLLESKSNVGYYFSKGLIADLKNDCSGNRERLEHDLDVVESIVGENLLNINKKGEFPLMKKSPLVAYETYNDVDSDLLKLFDELIPGVLDCSAKEDRDVLEMPVKGHLPVFNKPVNDGRGGLPKKELVSKKVIMPLFEQFRVVLKTVTELRVITITLRLSEGR